MASPARRAGQNCCLLTNRRRRRGQMAVLLGRAWPAEGKCGSPPLLLVRLTIPEAPFGSPTRAASTTVVAFVAYPETEAVGELIAAA